MNVLQLAVKDDDGGACRGALRLTRAIRQAGVDSTLHVKRRLTDDSVVQAAGSLSAMASYGWSGLLDLSLCRLGGAEANQPFSTGIGAVKLSRFARHFSADVLNLHWVSGGYVDIASIRRCRVPVVWTLHDSWAFTGGCHVPQDCPRLKEHCGRCPQLRSRRTVDLSRFVWRRKYKGMRGANIALVSPSRWLAGCATQSPILRDHPIHVIPNPLDTDVYRPVPKSTAKALLGLDPGKRHVLFSALNSRGDHNKGVSDLTPVREAIRADAMLRDVELVALGRREDKDACGVRWLGKMRDDITMALAYSAADTLVMLSRSENLPYTVAEAMACGTPCVAYDVGGIGELVTPGEHGLLAHPFVVEELARAVVEVLRWEESRGTAERCRDKIMNMCGAERIAHEYTTLYQTLIERSARKLVVSCR